jgi:hypothetical protein
MEHSHDQLQVQAVVTGRVAGHVLLLPVVVMSLVETGWKSCSRRRPWPGARARWHTEKKAYTRPWQQSR